MMRRTTPDDLIIIPTKNGYIVDNADARRNGGTVHDANVFESIEGALKHIADAMGEKVNVYQAV